MRRLLTGVLALFVIGCVQITPPPIVVFGDSLSDVGNVQLLTTQLQPDLPDVPARRFNGQPLYSDGKVYGRFTNGRVWLDWLVGEKKSVEPSAVALSDPLRLLRAKAVGFAWGGATALPRDDEFEVKIPDLLQQVDQYFELALLCQQHLGIVWIGSNDFRRLSLDDLDQTRQALAEIRAVQLEALRRLDDCGVERLVLFNQFNVGLIPSVIDDTTLPDQLLISQLIEESNRQLREAVNRFNRQNNQYVRLFDVNAVLTSWAEFFAVTQRPCWNGRVDGSVPDGMVGGICPQPDDYLFFDRVHPTTRAHWLVANSLKKQLSHWGMMQQSRRTLGPVGG